jgi:hypothetical protein
MSFAKYSWKISSQFLSNLLRMINNQSSMMRFLSSVKTDESNNFLNIKTITSSSVINKSVFEFVASTFFSRCFILNSRIMNITSCSYSLEYYNSSSTHSSYLSSYLTVEECSMLVLHVRSYRNNWSFLFLQSILQLS